MWAKCVDNAKEKEEDFVAKCSDSFGFLLTCQGENSEYFKEIFGSPEENEGGSPESGENHSNTVEP